MNYVYFQVGNLPSYLKFSIDSVLKNDPDSKIYLITDKEFKYKNVITLNTQRLESSQIKELKKINYFSNWDTNPLWESSLLRVFYLHEAARSQNINKFIHFDSDVVLFEPFEKIESLFEEKLNITPLSKDFLVFGYSYIGNIDLYEEVCKLIFNVYKQSDFYENKYYRGKKLIEMKALYIVCKENPEYFNLLPVHPEDSSLYVFDPASYGQYVGGTHNKRFSKGFTDKNHILGKDLKDKKIKPTLKKNLKVINFNSKDYKLVNLHVHNKKLKKYFNY